MAKITREKLLKNEDVIAEISRHKWIESEKAGYDIGMDQAADDWIKRFSRDWLKYHMPNKTLKINLNSKNSKAIRKDSKKK